MECPCSLLTPEGAELTLDGGTLDGSFLCARHPERWGLWGDPWHGAMS